jgi:hypothetical protein
MKSAAGFFARVPSIIGSFYVEKSLKISPVQTATGVVGTSAWAMFFTNIYQKNRMNVSRETLPNYCAEKRFLLTA